MQKAKTILSIILLASVLASVAVAATYLVALLPIWMTVPLVVVVWSGIALAGVYAYERGK